MSVARYEVASSLGEWTYHEWTPPRLAHLVERIWHWDGVTTHRERVFPSGLLQIIVQLDGRYHDASEGRRELTPWSCLVGIQPAAMVVEPPPCRCCVMGIRLRPAGAFALLSIPTAEVSGITVDLRDLLGRASEELIEACRGTVTAEERLGVVERWIAARVARARMLDPAVAWTAARIESARGAVSIGALQEAVGSSKTRFVNSFRDQIGVAPKLYARIHRFQHVLSLLSAGAASLADVAAAGGYYDQPHMTAEFREMTGLAPGDFLRADRFENSASVAERI